MKWYDPLYVGESISGKENRFKWKIEHNRLTLSIYVIAFASNPDNLLDLIPAKELLQPGYPKKELHIIGLAKGYEEAVDQTVRIIDEVYKKTGTVDVRQYLGQVRRDDT